MGQYYHIFNFDKKQQIYPFDYENGLKLMEWAYNRNYVVLTLTNLLTHEWKGDRVYVIGDYADQDNSDEVWINAYRSLLAECGLHTESDSVYDAAINSFERVLPSSDIENAIHQDMKKVSVSGTKVDITDHEYRYIYNHATKQVIDLNKCPVEWTMRDGRTVSISPLVLLLTMGNGRGGGDYRNKQNQSLLGNWCDTVQSIEVAKDLLDNCKDYVEFIPNFTERNGK